MGAGVEPDDRAAEGVSGEQVWTRFAHGVDLTLHLFRPENVVVEADGDDGAFGSPPRQHPRAHERETESSKIAYLNNAAAKATLRSNMPVGRPISSESEPLASWWRALRRRVSRRLLPTAPRMSATRCSLPNPNSAW